MKNLIYVSLISVQCFVLCAADVIRPPKFILGQEYSMTEMGSEKDSVLDRDTLFSKELFDPMTVSEIVAARLRYHDEYMNYLREIQEINQELKPEDKNAIQAPCNLLTIMPLAFKKEVLDHRGKFLSLTKELQNLSDNPEYQASVADERVRDKARKTAYEQCRDSARKV